jgi:thiol-disulfide isomerase/thioredoxin
MHGPWGQITMKRAILGLLAVAVTGCGSGSKAPSASTGPESQNPAAAEASDSADVPLAIVDYQGIQDHLARHQGKVVVMDAWSTSCPPCMKEFHNLVELHKQHGPERLACMSLSFDYEGLEKPEEVRVRVLKFLTNQGATFDNLMSNEESDTLYRKFKLAAVPAVFVYDRAGQLRKRFDNERAKTKEEAFTYEQVGQLVAELLAEEPATSSTATKSD